MKLEISEIKKDLKMPSNTYLVGDPCYLLQDYKEFWDLFCEALGEHDHKKALNVKIRDGKKTFNVIIFGTYDGDGAYDLRYKGRAIRKLPVDSGCLGIIPADILKRIDNANIAHYETVALPGHTFTIHRKGVVSFGDCEINTSPI